MEKAGVAEVVLLPELTAETLRAAAEKVMAHFSYTERAKLLGKTIGGFAGNAEGSAAGGAGTQQLILWKWQRILCIGWQKRCIFKALSQRKVMVKDT